MMKKYTHAIATHHCRFEDREKITLFIEYRHWLARLLRWLALKPTTATLVLDDLGSATWRLINGNNSCQTIAQKLSEHTTTDLADLLPRVIVFIEQLHRKNLILLRYED